MPPRPHALVLVGVRPPPALAQAHVLPCCRCVTPYAGAVDQGSGDSRLELGGVPLHTRGKVGDTPLEDRVETEQHDRREGVEQLRCGSAQTAARFTRAAPVEQMHASAVHFIARDVDAGRCGGADSASQLKNDAAAARNLATEQIQEAVDHAANKIESTRPRQKHSSTLSAGGAERPRTADERSSVAFDIHAVQRAPPTR